MSALIVLPTYQEAGNIAVVLRRLRAAVPDASILVVDDGSPDGTADMAEAVGAELHHIEVLRRRAKAGLGSAYRDGMGRGLGKGFDPIVQMDADLSHDPAAVPSLLRVLEQGSADVAVGSRYVDGGSIPEWPLHRRMLSRWGNRYATAVLGLPLHDATSGFRAYRADILRRIDLASCRAEGYGFLIEVAHRVAREGGRMAEVPIQFVDRTRGQSKMSGAIIVEALGLVTWWGVRDRALRARTRRSPPGGYPGAH